MSNKKDWIEEKLSRLVKLCKSTEPDNPDDNYLFTPHNIEAHSLVEKVQDDYGSMTNRDIIDVMKQANIIWRIRKKIYNGEWDNDWEAQMHLELEVHVKNGQKIAAIKHYRSEMAAHITSAPTLREAKVYIDALYGNMKKKGTIK